MKNILLASTAIVAFAGAAAADVTLSGSANVGLGELNGGSGDLEMYQNISVVATMAGETDNGLTFGASLTIRNGDDLDLDVGDLNDDGTLSTTSFGNIFISGAFGKLTFDREGIDNLQNDDHSHDVQYDYSVGDLAFALTVGLDDDPAESGVEGEEFSASVAYGDGTIAASLAMEDGGDFDAKFSYQINEMINVGITHESDNNGGAGENTLNLQYKTGPVTVDLDLSDVNGEYDLSVAYAEGPLSLYAKIGNDDSDNEDWDLSAKYDLGGGLSISALTNQSEAYYVGLAMSF